jgi:hypothetical protein
MGRDAYRVILKGQPGRQEMHALIRGKVARNLPGFLLRFRLLGFQGFARDTAAPIWPLYWHHKSTKL